MKRKAIQLANQTIVVSLPAKWVKQLGVKKGDEINIEENSGDLIVSAKNEKKEVKETINMEEWGILKNRIVLNSYLKGVDELEIRFSDPMQVEEIRNRIINELIGFEIIKQNSNYLILKEITTPSDQDFETILRRIFLIIKSNSEELLNSLKKSKRDLDNIILTDITINKLCYYCIRILNKKGYKNYKNAYVLYSIILTLENMGDIYKIIAKKIIKNELKIMETDLKNLELLNSLFCILENIFIKKDPKDIVSLAEKYEYLKKRLRGKSKMDLYINNLLLDIIMINNGLLMTI